MFDASDVFELFCPNINAALECRLVSDTELEDVETKRNK
jgi:hypothetical protein